MRHRYIGGALLAAAAVLAGPSTGTGPDTSPARGRSRPGEDGGFQTRRQHATRSTASRPGRPGDAGFYTAFEFVMLTQTRAIGHQTIATAGSSTRTGSITGDPGHVRRQPGTEAINTRDFRPTTYQPGFNVETRVPVRRRHAASSSTTCSWSTPTTRWAPAWRRPSSAQPPDLANTFLTAPVYNFNVAFAGPGAARSNGQNPASASTASGTAATQMDIKFTQRYQEANFGARVPVLPDRIQPGLRHGRRPVRLVLRAVLLADRQLRHRTATPTRWTPPTTPTPCRSACTARSSAAATRSSSPTSSRSAAT